MLVTYQDHSGFTVKTTDHLLIFDFIGGTLTAPQPTDRAVAFVSHAHGDHFIPAVDKWRSEGLCELVAGFDVPTKGLKMRPGDALTLDDLHIFAFGSTDQGVSFLVETDGMRIFHAGDYNYWHWRQESTTAEIEAAHADFRAILQELKGQEIDIAFFPVDPRMGEGYDEGAVEFIHAMRPRHFIPMHFGRETSAASQFSKRSFDGVKIHALTKSGQSIEIEAGGKK